MSPQAHLGCAGIADRESLEFCLEGALYGLGISRVQLVLVSEIAVSPCGGIVT